jgi:hypothetical protein
MSSIAEKLRSGESALFHGGIEWHRHDRDPAPVARGSRWCLRPPGPDEKCRACEQLGADRAINYRNEDFVEVVKQATGGRGVDRDSRYRWRRLHRARSRRACG